MQRLLALEGLRGLIARLTLLKNCISIVDHAHTCRRSGSPSVRIRRMTVCAALNNSRLTLVGTFELRRAEGAGRQSTIGPVTAARHVNRQFTSSSVNKLLRGASGRRLIYY
ncbi:hypothetical protein EVAR_33016_1 [Eumeta japonica]|uniref:Uncharacterized protein n=1 Tax=Eumeta variegata TaxID=151549 RepID=A0A4C1VSV9_EUMVA|nr:hypothetical protein EVAR_33016_1 [Eumeta japonica]